MSLNQLKLPFPRRKKMPILKTTKDKMLRLLSNDKRTAVQTNEQCLTLPSTEGTSSPRASRSSSDLPRTPRSLRSTDPPTPSTLLTHLSLNSPRTSRTMDSPKTSRRLSTAPETPSTALEKLSLHSPKAATPSSRLSSLQLNSPKRKMPTDLDFASPKRMTKETAVERSTSRLNRSRSLFNEVSNTSERSSNRSFQDQRSVHRCKLNSPLGPVNSVGISPLKRSERLANSPLKKDENCKRSEKLSPAKQDKSSKRLDTKSPGKKLSVVQMKSVTDIEDELFASDFDASDDSPCSTPDSSPAESLAMNNSQTLTARRTENAVDSASKKAKSGTNKGSNDMKFTVSIKCEDTKSKDIESVLFESEEFLVLYGKTKKHSPCKTPVKSDQTPVKASARLGSPRGEIKFWKNSPVGKEFNSPRLRNKFNLENSPLHKPIGEIKESSSPRLKDKMRSENSPLGKTKPRMSPLASRNLVSTESPLQVRSPLEGDYLKPLSPIKNIILDKKSPFKAFIREGGADLKSPAKQTRSPRKKLFQAEENNTVEEKDLCALPGRGAQLEQIRQFLLKHLNKDTSASLYISGPPGTGKSASLNVLVNEDGIKGAFTRVYINCNSVRSASSVYETVASQLKLKAGGKSERHQLAAILKFFETNRKHVLLILDEIDALETRKQTILYSIFEWPAIPGSKLVLIGVANALDLTDRMLPRLQANIKLQPVLMNFAPYSKHQILDIISHKLKKTDKFNMFNASALQLLAAKVAAVSGDVRKAIDITNHLVDLTYNNVKENGEVCGIGLKDVLDVISSVYCTSQSLNCAKDQDSFPLQQKLALASLLLLKTKSKVKDVTLGKLHDVYRKVCTQRNLQPLDMSEFISATGLLDARGVIKVFGKTKNRMSKVTLQWDEQDISEALRDKQLVSTILNDTSCL